MRGIGAGGEEELGRDDARLVVRAHEGAESEVEGDPEGGPEAQVGAGFGEVHGGEEERDGGEEEARFLVGGGGEDEDARDGGIEA